MVNEDIPTWKRVLNWFLDRFNETSTYVAIFNFLAVCGVIVKPELADLIKNVCIAIDALVLFLINENKEAIKSLEEAKELITLGYEYKSIRNKLQESNSEESEDYEALLKRKRGRKIIK